MNASITRSSWSWPLAVTNYDRAPFLTADERKELAYLVTRREQHCGAWRKQSYQILEHLLRPIHDVCNLRTSNIRVHADAVRVFVLEMHRRGTPYWVWSTNEWIETIGLSYPAFRERQHCFRQGCRQYVVACAYLLCHFKSFRLLGQNFCRYTLATHIFGEELVVSAIQRVIDMVVQWGYGQKNNRYLRTAVSDALLLNGSPFLEDLTLALLEELYHMTNSRLQDMVGLFSRVLASFGILDRGVESSKTYKTFRLVTGENEAVSPTWVQWCKRWVQTSTLAGRTKKQHYYDLIKTGRWLAETHPLVTSPEDWTYELTIEFVAAVSQMTIGQWGNQQLASKQKYRGKMLRPRSKQGLIASVRAFFSDCQEWHWIVRTFDPRRALATPRSIQRLIGPDPRVIDTAIWSKLLWAGIHLKSEDLPRIRGDRAHVYPLELVRAIAIVWLFAGLRADEICRLRVGCIRWQGEPMTSVEPQELPKDAVCLLDVPVNKTGTAYTKPVHGLVGTSIQSWEQVRPQQMAKLDAKTAEEVHFLFFYRGKQISRSYVNATLIPMLCHKAGVEMSDGRGRITSHRARATIASLLYNAKEPLTLFELQAWLNHRNIHSTQSYTKVFPTKLANAYIDADYFDRNMRTVEVLLDQEAILSGTAAQGETWKYFDLGHGYCTYTFFEQCPHRMSCAKCSFYLPKSSMKAQILEGKAHLARMLERIPLTEEERVAVEEGMEHLEKLTRKLADIPTPEGLTPKELASKRPQLPVLPTLPKEKKNDM